MEKTKNGERIGVYLNDELLTRCDLAMELSGSRSRSEFIRDALEHYIAVLNTKESSKVLTPALESVISGRIGMTEDRLSRILFKLGVEIAMMNNILAATHNINDATMDDLRRMCTNIVAKIGGKYSLEDAIDFQRSET